MQQDAGTNCIDECAPACQESKGISFTAEIHQMICTFSLSDELSICLMRVWKCLSLSWKRMSSELAATYRKSFKCRQDQADTIRLLCMATSLETSHAFYRHMNFSFIMKLCYND